MMYIFLSEAAEFSVVLSEEAEYNVDLSEEAEFLVVLSEVSEYNMDLSIDESEFTIVTEVQRGEGEKVGDWQVGESVRIKASIEDAAGDPADPSTVKASIKDADKNLVLDEAAMVNDGTGKYYYDYTTSATATPGNFTYKVVGTGATGRVTIANSGFLVSDSL